MSNDNLTLLRLLHQCAHSLSASEKYRGQGRLLNLLREHGTLTQKELTSLSARRPATLSEQLEKMESAGYLVREKNALDRRNIDVKLTPLGNQAALEASADRQRRAQVFDCLSTREKDTLTQILEKLWAFCQTYEVPGDTQV